MDLTFNGNEPQTILFNNQNVARVKYNDNDVWYQKFNYTDESYTFPYTLSKTLPYPLTNYKIYGQTNRDGTPSSATPADIEEFGELITDTQDEHYGQYKIPVLATDINNNTITTNIYLDEPLRRCQWRTRLY